MNIVVPQLALMVAGAHLLVVAAVVIVGIDYIDVRPVRTWSRACDRSLAPRWSEPW